MVAREAVLACVFVGARYQRGRRAVWLLVTNERHTSGERLKLAFGA